MKRNRFDIEYNKWLQQVDVEEDNTLWNEIRDELDFIETWGNISAKLDVVKPPKVKVAPMRYLKVLAATAAVILIVFLPVRYFMEQSNQPTLVSGPKESDKNEKAASNGTNLLKAAKEGVDIVDGIDSEVRPAKNLVDKSFVSSSSNKLRPIIVSKESESAAFSPREIDLHKIQSIPFDANTLLASIDAISPNSIVAEFNVVSQPGKSSGISFRVVEVGLVYGYKNTWLLNHETRNGLDPGKIGNVLPTFHQDIGLSSSFVVNNQHQFGLEFLWKSGAGQNYQQYINASYVNRNINLDYLKLQTYYFLGNNKFPAQAIVGGYIARLTMAEEQQDKTRFNVDGKYNDLDYGLLAGYQFNIALKNSVILKPSFRVSYNLVNIFEGDDVTPSHFKRTKNLAASFNITLSFRVFK